MKPLLRPWHALCIWWFGRKIRKQRRDLAKFIRRSAYEISAWRQDIASLREQRQYHLAFLSPGIKKAIPDVITPHEPETAADNIVHLKPAKKAAAG